MSINVIDKSCKIRTSILTFLRLWTASSNIWAITTFWPKTSFSKLYAQQFINWCIKTHIFFEMVCSKHPTSFEEKRSFVLQKDKSGRNGCMTNLSKRCYLHYLSKFDSRSSPLKQNFKHFIQFDCFLTFNINDTWSSRM